jgi:hypothetical protein
MMMTTARLLPFVNGSGTLLRMLDYWRLYESELHNWRED